MLFANTDPPSPKKNIVFDIIFTIRTISQCIIIRPIAVKAKS